MKISNVSNIRIYLHDLRFTREAQSEGRNGEDMYLNPGASVYVPNTSEVIRSAFKGDLRKWRDQGIIELEETISIDASETVTLNHNLGLPPSVNITKQVGDTWVDATGTFNAVHNIDFTAVGITNTTSGTLGYFIRLG